MPGPADGAPPLLLVNGAVWSPGWGASRQLAVAAADGRVAALGEAAELRRAWPGARLVDLGGRLLMPAFHDAHVHAASAGLDRLRCDLTQAGDLAGYRRLVEAALARLGEGEWLLGSGWSLTVLAQLADPRALLDELAGGRPAFLLDDGHHDAWANSAALRRAGVSGATPDPPDGRIGRVDGEASGLLFEGAMRLVADVVPPPDAATRRAGLLEAQRHLHRLGIASWQEAIVGSYPGIPDCLGDYLAADEAGVLGSNVLGALWWDRHRGLDQLAELAERRRSGSARFRPLAVKLMLDGTCENHTAALHQPYACSPAGEGDHGLLHVDPELLAAAVPRLDADGFQLHFHAIGDRAVAAALDSLARAREENGPPARQHHVAHVQLVAASDRARFAELGVTANCQPLWAHRDTVVREINLPALGPERVEEMYPFASLARAGAPLGCGSDWPVSSADPLQGIHVAVNRRAPVVGADEESLLGEGERLGLEAAMTAYTAGSARLNQLPGSGRIEPGADADLIVLDRDVFARPLDELCAASVIATLVGGRPVSGELG